MPNRRELLKTLGLATLGATLRQPVAAAFTDNLTAMQTPAGYVNPFIGTGAHGHTYPGATVPFGMVQLSPDNGVAGWDWCSGYHYSSDTIAGFSYTHLSGTGIGDLYDLRFMPCVTKGELPSADYRAKFKHDNESAAPGYYRVRLDDGIQVELTATERTGWQRYTFPLVSDPTQRATVILDLGASLNWDAPTETFLNIENGLTISGYRYSKGWAPQQKVYFVAHLYGGWRNEIRLESDGQLLPASVTQARGRKVRAIMSDAPGTASRGEIIVGISPVSIENARANLVREAGYSGIDSRLQFDDIRRAAWEKWEQALSRVIIETPDANAKTTFYTALYHLMLAPTLFDDQTAGSRQQAAGSQQQAADSRQPAAGSQQQAADSQQPAAGSQQQTAGSEKLLDSWQPAADSQQSVVSGPQTITQNESSQVGLTAGYLLPANGLPVSTQSESHEVGLAACCLLPAAGYSTFSLWDTFRAAHPLFTIVQPERVDGFCQSMMALYRQTGLLPVWTLWGQETNTMIGYHAVPVLYDALKKGLTTVDKREALAAMKRSALQRKHGLQYYQMPEPVTLEQLQAEAAKEELPRIGTITPEQLAQFGPLVAGWQRSTSGPTIGYHSAYPHVKQALISRASDGKQRISWQTAPVPQTTAETTTFVWLAGIDVDVDEHRFDLAVNGVPWLSFRTPKTLETKTFSVMAENGAKLTFHATHQDQFGDYFGFMFLSVPRRWLTADEPLRLSVTGEKADADDWYMTFEHELANRLNVSNVFALVKADGTVKQVVRVLAENLGPSQKLQLTLIQRNSISDAWRVEVPPQSLTTGAQTFFVAVPQVTRPSPLHVEEMREMNTAKSPDTLLDALPKMTFSTLRPVRLFDYLPADWENEAVSKTLEYAYDDWCIAQLAKDLGATADYELFSRRAQFYRNLFDKETGFMRGKLADGSWRTPFAPKFSQHRQDDYTEGNAWQYTWSVMHDVVGLIELMGGREAFIKKLDQLFAESSDLEGTNASPDISGLIGQYAHGNEPSHHIAYLYALAGRPDKTQERVREITTKLYHATPEGLCGNEDCGQMSAWYIFSTLGFYPVNPANGEYVIGTPHFPSATLKLPDNKTFRIIARNVSAENCYTQSAKLNGQPFTKNFITHQQIMAGGTLEFTMSNRRANLTTN